VPQLSRSAEPRKPVPSQTCLISRISGRSCSATRGIALVRSRDRGIPRRSRGCAAPWGSRSHVPPFDGIMTRARNRLARLSVLTNWSRAPRLAWARLAWANFAQRSRVARLSPAPPPCRPLSLASLFFCLSLFYFQHKSTARRPLNRCNRRSVIRHCAIRLPPM